ncbi:MAG: ECF transporter S component [Clostridia bacterium]|nr:ECF transporter S component [Clostridia bacterium]
MEHKEQEVLHHVTSESGARRTPRRFHRNNTQYMVTLALLAALVVVLQLWGSAIPIGTTSLSLVLIPIVIGGLVLGVRAGAFLGLVFGVFVFVFCGVLGNDPFTAFLFAQRPVMTALICIVKGGVAGLVPPLVHRALSRRFPHGSVVLAATVAPICNTGIFLLGMLIIVSTLRTYLAGAMTVGYFFGAIILVNFAVELAVNLIVSPAIYRIVHAVAKQQRH